MAQTPLEQALDRAERALNRIRHSAARPVPAAPVASVRDDQLRREVTAAIAELDRILAEAGGTR